MARDHELAPDDVAQWLLRRKRSAVIDGLTGIVCQVMEQWNDDDKVGRVLRAKPDLEPLVPVMRQVSETLGVSLWYLLDKLDDEQSKRCLVVAHFIHKLREAEAVATLEAMKAAEDFLRPVMDGNPNMTVGQAVQELQRQTDKTIRGLEPPAEDRPM
jgi:hypothetical protein